jgi:imidazolonepropionase
MTQIYKSAWLATADSNNLWKIYYNAAMIVKDGSVVWIGEDKNIPTHDNCEIIDVGQSGILPGFIDCHTHLVFAGDRTDEFVKRQSGVSYSQIQKQGGGIFSTVASTREATEQDLLALSLQRIQSWIKQGVTSLEIKSGYGLDLETEKKILSVANKLSDLTGLTIHKTFLGAHVCPKEFKSSKEYLDYIIKTVLPDLIDSKLVDSVDAFCESIAFSAEELKPFLQQCKDMGLRCRLHADQLSDSGACELAANMNALSVDHIEYSNSKSISALKKSNSVAVLLPGAYYYLNEDKKPPIDLLRKHSIPIAIATDCNPGSSPIYSLCTIMNMSCVLFNLSVEEALLGITVNAAKALNLEKKGKLAPGFDADFAVWDIDNPASLVANINNWQCQQLYLRGKPYEF